MRALKHAAVIIAALCLLLVLPLHANGAFAVMRGEADTVSSATQIPDTPSGAYVVLVKKSLHEKNGTLQTWADFFSGKEIGIVFEDIDCLTALGDAGGSEFAKSLQSRLPENQMRLRSEERTLVLSKARAGMFDVIVLSKEAYELTGADAKGFDDTLVLNVAE